jgi:hypothetical protein
MGKIRKIRLLIGLKGILSIACLTTIALALVAYTASVTMTPKVQFTIEATSDSWNLYVNELDQVRYLPGGIAAPSGANPPSTYAFKVETDATKACAVKIELTSAMDDEKFSNFDITVNYWTGTAWTSAILYNSPTGSTMISAINGLTTGAAGYIQQSGTTTTYYLVKVTYSYNLVADTTPITAIFQYTPLATA